MNKSAVTRKIVLVTDAWEPQVNGVVRTWSRVIEQSTALGHQWLVIHPGLFRTVAAPRYPEIRLAFFAGRKMRKLLDDYQPDVIHIATEGTLGMKARRICLQRRWPFTTSYHTQFPLYMRQYFMIPQWVSWSFERWFHKPASHTLVPTASMGRELESQGLSQVVTWTRGVDAAAFSPNEQAAIPGVERRDRPFFIYAGRVAHEKNIEAFLKLDLPGTKIVVGDGPILPELRARYPDVHFAGYRFGRELADHYAAADVFVFPSRTDTFGIVMLEAGACGLPVAAYPVTGPIDVVKQGVSGCLNEDLRQACLDALKIDRAAALAHARTFTWERCARMLLEHLQPVSK